MTLIRAPVLTAAQADRLALFLSGCAVLAEASCEDLAARGVVRDRAAFRRFRGDPLQWLRAADELPVLALWLLVEEQHALRQAHFAARP